MSPHSHPLAHPIQRFAHPIDHIGCKRTARGVHVLVQNIAISSIINCTCTFLFQPFNQSILGKDSSELPRRISRELILRAPTLKSPQHLHRAWFDSPTGSPSDCTRTTLTVCIRNSAWRSLAKRKATNKPRRTHPGARAGTGGVLTRTARSSSRSCNGLEAARARRRGPS